MTAVPVALSLWLYLSHSSAIDSLVMLSKEALSMSTLSASYHMLSNVLLLTTIDVQARVNPPLNITINETYLTAAFRIDSEFYNTLLENTRLHSDAYQNTINSIMNSNFCDVKGIRESYDTGFYPLGDSALCQNKTKSWDIDSYLAQGFRAGFAFYQDSIYDIYNQLNQYKATFNTTGGVPSFPTKSCRTPGDYDSFCMFTYPNIHKNYLYQNIYLDLIMKYMMDLYKSDLNEYIVASISSQASTIFSLFIIAMVVGYLVVVLRTFLEIRNDYFLVQKMVLMVPLSSIRYSRYIKDFFKEHLSQMLR